MDLPFEAAKGTAEQLLNVRSPIYMRVGLPGALATAVLYPAVRWVLEQLPSAPEYLWQRVVAYIGMAFLLGGIISIFSGEVYEIYEGRTRWPDWLLRWATARQEARLTRLKKQRDDARAKGDNNLYAEIWVELRLYPMDERGEAVVQRPTLLGNILFGYEQYPDNRYGMDSVFYWPRIWLMVEKEKKEEIDGQWSLADGFLTMSAVSLAGGALWILEAAAGAAGLMRSTWLPFGSAGWAIPGGLAWCLVGYVFYRLSLPFHRENGEIFKSIFDVYRAKVWSMTKLKPLEAQAWDAAWNYLQYLRVVCPVCNKTTAFSEENCKICGNDLRPLTRRIRESGKFE